MSKLPTVHCLIKWDGWKESSYVDLTEKTAKIGFPNSQIIFHALPFSNHYKWISWLIDTYEEPFIVLDCDLVFHSSCEWFTYRDECILKGRYTPSYRSPFTKCIDQQRLHTSFLYINPVRLKARMAEINSKYPVTEFLPIVDYVKPLLIPSGNTGLFYDTMAVAYNAVGGDSFHDSELDCYDHMQSGTLVDLVAPHLKDIDLKAAHKAIIKNPSIIKGQWRVQNDWYKNHPPYPYE